MNFPVAIFGMGRFGRALASRLDEVGGALVRIGGRGRAQSDRLPLIAAPAAFLAGLPAATLIVLSVRDDAIAGLSDELAALPGASGYRFVHSSGASGLGVLQALRATGAATGVFHLLQSLPPEGGETRIPGSYAAVAGEATLVGDLRALALAVGATPVELSEAQWPAYHAAAVLASNALLGLLDSGRAILEEAGLGASAAQAMLLPLVAGTLENARAFGLEEALTGPVVRGDAGTIRRHLQVLRGPTRSRYIAAMQAVLALAERAGRTPIASLQEIRELLEKG